MSYFLDPKNDVVFKRIFGNEKKKDVLISFLNAALNRENEKAVASITLLNPVQPPEVSGGKETVVDIRCADGAGKEYIIEMQMLSRRFFCERVVYYASRAYCNQMREGGNYDELTPVIFLGIVNFEFTQKDLPEEEKHYLSSNYIMDIRTHKCKLTPLEFHFIELPLFRKKEEELTTVSDQWIYFLKHAPHLTAIPESIKDEAIKEAFEVADVQFWSPEEQDAVFRQVEYLSRQVDHAAERFEEGIEKGMEKGSLKEKKAIGWSMLQSGISIEEVARMTGLSKNSVEKIKKDGES